MVRKKTDEIDWTIDIITDGKCDVCGKYHKDIFVPYICDARTAGLDKYGHMEFQFVLKLRIELICEILNLLGRRVQSGEIFKAGCFVHHILEKYPVRLDLQTSDDTNYLRVIVPDEKGLWPEDPECNKVYALQKHPIESLYFNKSRIVS